MTRIWAGSKSKERREIKPRLGCLESGRTFGEEANLELCFEEILGC
jgi:hypothetical protein